MLSLKKGRPIAKVVGGSENGVIIHVSDEKESAETILDDNQSYSETDCEDDYSETSSEGSASGSDQEEDNSDVEDARDNLSVGDNFDEDQKIFEISDGKMVQIPNIETREIVYIAGPSGSGKSTYAGNYANYLKKIFPDKEVFLFSRKDSDPAFDSLKPNRIKIDNGLVENPIDLTQELSSGAIVIFDDVNTINDDKQKKAVDKLMADIMEVGRSYGIYIIITNHLVIPNEKKIARTIMNELHTMTVFPKSGSAQQITYALKTYFGLDKKQIEVILKIPSRWVTISKSYPQYVICENGVFLL